MLANGLSGTPYPIQEDVSDLDEYKSRKNSRNNASEDTLYNGIAWCDRLPCSSDLSPNVIHYTTNDSKYKHVQPGHCVRSRSVEKCLATIRLDMFAR